MTPSGNLVLREPDKTERWSSGTATAGASAVLQVDGNLVIVEPSGQPIWAIGPATGHARADELRPGEALLSGDRLVSPGGAVLEVQPYDGNIVLRAGGKATWSTGGQTGHAYRDSALVMQMDGNLVAAKPTLVGGKPEVFWASDTVGKATWARITNGYLELIDANGGVVRSFGQSATISVSGSTN
jgi:hypothetical protein